MIKPWFCFEIFLPRRNLSFISDYLLVNFSRLKKKKRKKKAAKYRNPDFTRQNRLRHPSESLIVKFGADIILNIQQVFLNKIRDPVDLSFYAF